MIARPLILAGKAIVVSLLLFSAAYSMYVGFDLSGTSGLPVRAHEGAPERPPAPALNPAAPAAVQPLPERAPPAPSPEKPAESSASHSESEIRAQLQPVQYTTISSEVPGKIQRIAFREGQAFRKGAVLIELDCALQKAQLRKAHATLDAAERTAVANRRLFELSSVGQIEMENSAAEAEKARAEVAFMATTVSKCTIKAPFDGKVAEQKGREEQFVQPGQPVLDILNNGAMELEFLVPSKWLVWLNVRTRVSIHLDETDHTYPAVVKSIGAKADAVSQSVKITAVIAGDFPELAPGMSGKISIDKPPT